MTTKTTTKKGFWSPDPGCHPLIMEIQLGKSIKELCDEHFKDYNFEHLDPEDELYEIVSQIVKLNNPDLRFAVQLHEDRYHCRIIGLNGLWSTVELDYWDDEGNYARIDDALNDCDLLNQIVDRLFAVKREKPKPKITNRQYAKKERCPFCLCNKIMVLDTSWNYKKEVGCTNCGQTWQSEFRVVTTGFSH